MTRVAGHGLLREGAIYDENGHLPHGAVVRSGPGRGKCECGSLSEVLPSTAARRRWHADHKGEVGPFSSRYESGEEGR
ncbi:hypothetical protein [Dactylosporangium salmoneum]|uniref:Uncharacterized protein n=1 Tax=Dactylosporangium salmoneum TaxID=53361 RepID=A0ABN3GAE2_9ACTN